MKEVSTQIATSMSSDFEENTWTFLMPKGFQVWAGQFAIVDKPVYEKMLSVLKMIDDAYDMYGINLGMSSCIFEDVRSAIDAAEGLK